MVEQKGIEYQKDELMRPGENTSLVHEFHHARAEGQKKQINIRDEISLKDANGQEQEDSVGDPIASKWNILSKKLDRYLASSGKRLLEQASKGKRTSVSSTSTNTKRLIQIELDALKEQEKVEEQLAARKREAQINRKQVQLDEQQASSNLKLDGKIWRSSGDCGTWSKWNG